MKYPLGIQFFQGLREDGYVYVDKTQFVHQLVSSGKYYFLSRPRRFGKSLFLSTLRAFFEGKQELFDGLAIHDLEREWTKRPIFHLDLNAERYDTPESLLSILDSHLSRWESLYPPEKKEKTVALRFSAVIRAAAEQTRQKVVILVDEYDKPLLQSIGNKALQNEFRTILKAFYGNLKNCDEFIRFAFLTGVTKFGKVSVFSDLNHLTDISLLPQYADICGITEKDLHQYFDDEVGELATQNGTTKEEAYETLKLNFDGYHFCADSPGIYNPFSLLKTLAFRVYRDYWFETGTPTFLIHQLQKTNYRLDDITTEEVTAEMLNSIENLDVNPLPLLFQSGYLTIKEYNREFDTYKLGFPNHEVEIGFTRFLTSYFLPKKQGTGSFSVSHFVNELRSGDIDGFMRRLSSLFADGNYQVVGNQEIYFQNTLSVFLKMLGFYVDVERHTSDGRMDVVVQTHDYIYIFELKVNKDADTALKQIEEKGYAAPFATDPRKLYKIGVNFNTERRLIDDWKIV